MQAISVLVHSNSKLGIPNSDLTANLQQNKNTMLSYKLWDSFKKNKKLTWKKMPSFQNSAFSKQRAEKSLHTFHPPCFLLLEFPQTESVRDLSDSFSWSFFSIS